VNEKEFRIICNTLKACPFCGEKLVVHGDHHGYWIAHKNPDVKCFCGMIQIDSKKEADKWNCRA